MGGFWYHLWGLQWKGARQMREGGVEGAMVFSHSLNYQVLLLDLL